MKILVYGAGVLGSLYAARLKEAGFDVTLLARGRRLEELRTHGIVLMAQASGQKMTTPIHTIDTLRPDDAYDLTIVLVRKNQLPAALETLAANRCIPTFLFMVNNALGPAELITAVGRERVLLGFPGAGGVRQGHEVIYRPVPGWLQAAPVGELDGALTPRLKAVIAAFRQAGLPVQFHPNVDAWLKNHVALVSPMANAIYAAGGDVRRLARLPVVIAWMVGAVREGLEVLADLGLPVTPRRFYLLRLLPAPLLVAVLRLALNTQAAETLLAAHANAARDEMQALAGEFAQLAARSGRPTPCIDRLRVYIDPAVRPLEAPPGASQTARRVPALLLVASTALIAWLIVRGWKKRR